MSEKITVEEFDELNALIAKGKENCSKKENNRVVKLIAKLR